MSTAPCFCNVYRWAFSCVQPRYPIIPHTFGRGRFELSSRVQNKVVSLQIPRTATTYHEVTYQLPEEFSMFTAQH